MSTYTRQAGVSAVRIGTYPKRSRRSYATLERRPEARSRRIAPPAATVAEPSYADFFQAPSAVSEVA